MIEIRGLKRSYLTGEVRVEALKGIDLNIEASSFMAIAGPSGSGKTTLLNCIGCIDQADSGILIIEGKDLARMKAKELVEFRRQSLGFIFQSYNLIPVLTAAENVALPLQMLKYSKRETAERVAELLAEVGLEGMEDRLPKRLSGGQQQRVAIARSLIKNPAIVLADEPTANLDSHTGAEILKIMAEISRKYKTSFIFSTHDKMVMDYAQRLVVLHDGNIVSA